jgi:hypothetical protein
MPGNTGGQLAAASILRRRGLRRLSATTAGVGVASVLATGAIAAALPGPAHHSAAAGSGGTGSAAKSSAGSSGTGSGSGSQSSGGSGPGSSPSTLPSAASGGADATSGAS